jgi:peptide deformylase
MKKIEIYPKDILRVITKNVISTGNGLSEAAKELSEILRTGENAAGLAAPQIGLNQRFFGIKSADKKVRVFINPKIEITYGDKIFPKIVNDKDEEEDFLEGCLSFPDYYGTVKRYLRIDASWQELKNGKLIDQSGNLHGFEAIVFQHELDHLNGILFIDHVKEDGGKFYKCIDQKMKKWNLEEVIKGKL